MFDNIGGKIKALAQVVCWIGIIASAICGIIMMATGDPSLNLIGFLIIILGSLFSWIGSFMTYGFGQLIENTDKLVEEKNNVTHTVTTSRNTNDKLKLLNNWREQGLITEEEYYQGVKNLK